MAQHAATLAKANGVEHVVEVMQGSIEDLTLPEKGDLAHPSTTRVWGTCLFEKGARAIFFLYLLLGFESDKNVDSLFFFFFFFFIYLDLRPLPIVPVVQRRDKQ